MTKLMLMLFCYAAAEVIFEPEPTQSGIILTKISDIAVSTKNWDICIFYDLHTFKEESRRIRSLSATLNRLCEKINGTSNICILVINQLKLHEIHAKNRESIIDTYNSGQSRSRRAPLEIIGSFSKSLFGILDAESAKEYNSQIAALKENADYQFELSKKQTTLIENTILSQNQAVSQLQADLISLNAQISKLTSGMNNELNELHLLTRFNTVATACTLMIMHHDEVSGQIIRILTGILHGKATDLIASDIFRNILKNISYSLPPHETLPINIHRENPMKILQACTIKSTLFDDKIMMEIAVPIVPTLQSILFDALPVPFRSTNGTTIYSNIQPKFITNAEHTTIAYISNKAIDDCFTIDNKKICHMQHAFATSNENCELAFFNAHKNAEALSKCVKAQIPSTNYITKLWPKNKFFAYVSNPYTLRVLCNNDERLMTIAKNGYLSVDDGCSAISPHFTIIGTHSEPAHSVTILPPLPSFDASINEFNATKFTELSPHLHAGSLEKQQQIIDELKTAKLKPIKHVGHSTWTLILSISVLIFVISAIIFAEFRYGTKNSPKPRTTGDDATPSTRSGSKDDDCEKPKHEYGS